MIEDKPPEVIYLQYYENSGEVTWCQDKINDSDITYARVFDTIDEFVEDLESEG